MATKSASRRMEECPAPRQRSRTPTSRHRVYSWRQGPWVIYPIAQRHKWVNSPSPALAPPTKQSWQQHWRSDCLPLSHQKRTASGHQYVTHHDYYTGRRGTEQQTWMLQASTIERLQFHEQGSPSLSLLSPTHSCATSFPCSAPHKNTDAGT